MLPPVFAAASSWASWGPASCLPDDCFCEAVSSGLVRQPANTWSSLAFVVVALWVVIRAKSGAAPRIALEPGETSLFIDALVFVGVASAFYHASLTFVGQVLDVSAMYLVATFILLHRLAPRPGWSPPQRALAFAAVNAALIALQVAAPALRRPVFAVLLVAALAVEWRATAGRRRWLARGAGLIVAAGVIWSLDRFRVTCMEGLAFQGHAIWHILGALAAACLFLSYEEQAEGAGAS